MARLTLVPFGRGSSASVATVFNSPYSSIRTLMNSTNPNSYVKTDNFAQNAGFPEAMVLFNYPTPDGHNHSSYPIAVASIGESQIRFASGSGQSARDSFGLIGTVSPKVLCVFGTLPGQYMHSNGGDDVTLDVSFSTNSFTGQSFAAGTVPQIWTGVYQSPTVQHAWITHHVTSVTHAGFSCRLLYHYSVTGFYSNPITVYLMYIATGVAPGLLVPPGSIAG